MKPFKKGQSSICKVRGITLNFKNYVAIIFDTVKSMVTGNRTDFVTVVKENKIVCNSTTGHIITRRKTKDSRIIFDKRVIVKDYHTVPYGM